jgi:hypothetical protein
VLLSLSAIVCPSSDSIAIGLIQQNRPTADMQRSRQKVCFEGQADIDAPLLTNLDERVRVLIQSQRFSA